MEMLIRKWEDTSLGWKNLSLRNPHMWKSMMMRSKMKNGSKKKKWSIKETINLINSL